MYLVGLGVIFMLLKYFEVSPVAEWSWWWVLSPFAGAFVWWNWADATGYTKRKAMEREERERMERRDRQMEAIGQKPRSRRRSPPVHNLAARGESAAQAAGAQRYFAPLSIAIRPSAECARATFCHLYLAPLFDTSPRLPERLLQHLPARPAPCLPVKALLASSRFS